MASTIQIKASGLNTSPNELEQSGQGGLTTATNIIIRRDDTMESRRGFKLYGDSFGTSTDRCKQLISYKDRILRHFANTLQYDTLILNSSDESQFASFGDSITEAQTGLRIKTVESNGNLYLTTSEGIQKISAKTADDFTTASGFITKAGGIKAIDFQTEVLTTLGDQSSFFPVDSVVSYRIVWGYKDLNGNLILGSPSNKMDVYNPFLPIIVLDFNNLLIQLNNINQSPSLINDGNYASTLLQSNSSTASEVRTALINLATKLDTDIYLANDSGTGVPLNGNAGTSTITGDTVVLTFTSGDPSDYISVGDQIILSGFTLNVGADDINVAQTVTAVSSTTVTFVSSTPLTSTSMTNFGDVYSYNYRAITQPVTASFTPNHNELQSLQDYLNNIILRLQVELDGVIPTTLLNTYILPLNITTTSTVKLTINIPEDVSLNNFLQIYRTTVLSATGTDILSDLVPQDEEALVYESYPTSAEITAKEMIVEDIVLDNFRGANLYTNAITGEGIANSNEPPPFALDIAKFKNVVFYANTRNRQSKLFNFLGVTNFYSFTNASVITVGSPTSITSTAHGLTSGDEVTIQDSDSVPNIDGTYIVTVSDANTFTIPIDTTGGTNGTFATIFTNKNPKLTFASSASSNTYNFTLGGRENTNIIFDNTVVGSDFASSGTADYFTFNNANDLTNFYVWYYVNSGTMTDPAISNSTGLKVVINSVDTAIDIIEKTRDVINTRAQDFHAVSYTNGTDEILNFITEGFGYTTDTNLVSMPVGITLDKLSDGQGENLSTNEILLSTNASPAIAVSDTSQSFVRVMNNNSNETLYAYYLSSSAGVPGQLNIQARGLEDNIFYVISNGYNSNLTEFGTSFNPTISPTNEITNISVNNPTVITSNAHGLVNGDQIIISGSNSTPSIDGIYTISNSTTNTFTIPVNVTVLGTTGYFTSLDNLNISASSADAKGNRIYYSKLLEPEAVPIVNYFDVGADSKEILRIFPLRDSLFVLKEDGIYRISGENAPFNLALFDGSVFMTAPDSLGIVDNFLYFWTTKGIVQLSEAGVSIPPISRPIDNIILSINNSLYPNFKTATWGIGYNSDNSYLVYTTLEQDDEFATVCYRYNTLNNSINGGWTVYDKNNTCGVIHSDDKLYMGAGDINQIEQERKNFNRTDYADREYINELTINNYLNNGLTLKFVSIDNMFIGDSIVQEQYVTNYTFNQLLQKLDLDIGVADSDYYDLLNISGGEDLRDRLVNTDPTLGLAAKLDADTGLTDTNYLASISGASGTIANISANSPTVITLNNQNFTSSDVNTGTDIITISSHGFSDDETISFTTTGTLPSGLSLNTVYYIVNSSVNNFQVSTTLGGSAVDLTTGGSGTHTVWKNHDLQTGRVVNIGGNTTGSPLINGKYQVTVLNLYQFTIPVAVTTPGTDGNYETINENPLDLQACFNFIISKLNNDSGAAFNNYSQITYSTIQETIITDRNVNDNTITVATSLPFLIGNITSYRAIENEIIYQPNNLNDPLSLKHLGEATMMFGDRKFTQATMSFASDLVPAFEDITFLGSGNGIFGLSMPFGGNITKPQFFGGVGNSAPFRTYVPRNHQRCRTITIKFNHNIAREHYSILGISITGQFGISTRGYR